MTGCFPATNTLFRSPTDGRNSEICVLVCTSRDDGRLDDGNPVVGGDIRASFLTLDTCFVMAALFVAVVREQSLEMDVPFLVSR